MMKAKFVEGIRLICENPKCKSKGNQVTPYLQIYSEDTTGLFQKGEFYCPDCMRIMGEFVCSKT